MVYDEQLVGETAQVDAQAGRQVQGGQDPRQLRQPADQELLLGSAQSLVIACHVHPLAVMEVSRTQYAMRRTICARGHAGRA